MSKFELPKDFDFVGDWTRATVDGDKPIPGTMKWLNRRAHLALHDSFTPLRGDIYGDEVNEYAVIHGTSLDSKLITMLNASSVGGSFNFGPAGIRQPEKIRSGLVLVGAHVTQATTYSEMRVRIPGLERWRSRGVLEWVRAHQTNGKPMTSILQLDELPDEVFEVPAIGARIGFRMEHLFSEMNAVEVRATTSGVIRFEPEEPKELDWYFEHVGSICTMLGFIAGTPMGPDLIRVKINGGDVPLDVLVALRQDQLCPYGDSSKFFLSYAGLGAELGDVLRAWCSIYESFATPIQLAFSIFASEDLWMHVEFLSLMQALEGFHRAIGKGVYVSDEKFEPIRQALLDAIPDGIGRDHRQSIESRIRYANEISLSKRLNELAARLAPHVRQRVLGRDGKVPRSWVDTRNYYTHWDESTRDNVLDGIDMHRASARLRLMLRSLYLDLIGIPADAVVKALNGACKESQYLIQINNAEIRKSDPDALVTPLMSIRMTDVAEPGEDHD